MQVGIFAGWSARVGLLLLFVVANFGCGGGPIAATVTGTVTYRGDPFLREGCLSSAPTTRSPDAIINTDGSYEAQNVPLGPVKVAVTTPLPPPPEIQKAAKEGKRRFGKGNVIQVPTNNVVPIPVKYNDPAKSGLSLTVTQDTQPFLIELK